MAEGEDITEETATLKKFTLWEFPVSSGVRTPPTSTAGNIGCFTAKIKKKKKKKKDHCQII